MGHVLTPYHFIFKTFCLLFGVHVCLCVSMCVHVCGCLHYRSPAPLPPCDSWRGNVGNQASWQPQLPADHLAGPAPFVWMGLEHCRFVIC